MRRADRLFMIVQILRRARKPVQAEAIARELEVSVRTIYRDIADLAGRRVPIRGEAGVGYVLDRGFDMPPLMLTTTEAEAAVLGAQWVVAHAEPDLALAAQDLLAKLVAVAPADVRDLLLAPSTGVRPAAGSDAVLKRAAELQASIRLSRKVQFDYLDGEGRPTRRIVWPVLLGYRVDGRILAAWCELRAGFRWFLLNRMSNFATLDDAIPEPRLRLRGRWKVAMDEERRRYEAMHATSTNQTAQD